MCPFFFTCCCIKTFNSSVYTKLSSELNDPSPVGLSQVIWWSAQMIAIRVTLRNVERSKKLDKFQKGEEVG